MHKRPIHTLHRALKHILQTLPNIMTIMQTRMSIKHNIDFYIESIAGVVCLKVLDPADTVCEAHDNIQQDAAVGRGGGGAC